MEDQRDRLERLKRRIYIGETITGCPSPVRAFSGLVAGSARSGGSELANRLREAAAALAVLDLPARGLDAQLTELVMGLPPPPAQIVLAWAARQDNHNGRSPQTGEGNAAGLLRAEVTYHCRRVAGQLRSWGALPGHSDDSEGVVWGSYAFLRVTGRCDCAGMGCRHPRNHQLASWFEPSTHARPSGHFDLGSFLERAVGGHSPVFKPAGRFSQGLIAVAAADLDVGNAALRCCRSEQCMADRGPRIVAKGRPCPGCGEEPGGAIRLDRKVVNVRSWGLERFQRCGRAGPDEHFLERRQPRCPECDWRPAVPVLDYAECVRDGARFPVEDVQCPVCGTAVPNAPGLVRAWVHWGLPQTRPIDPHSETFRIKEPTEPHPADAVTESALRIGLSPAASELLTSERLKGRRGEQRVNALVCSLAAASPAWRARHALVGPPTLRQVNRARQALDTYCERLQDPASRELLRQELEPLLSQWAGDAGERHEASDMALKQPS